MMILYSVGAFTRAGWRQVSICAQAENTTPKMARVLYVVSIDGKPAMGWHSRTGAKRQQYDASSIAAREIGAIKRLSSCVIVNYPMSHRLLEELGHMRIMGNEK